MGFLTRHQRLVAFSVSACLLFALHQISGILVYPFDSSIYWDLSTTESITNFPETVQGFAIVRGYVFAAVVWPLHALGDALGEPILLFRVGTSLVYGYVLSGPIPEFFAAVLGGRLTWLRRTILVISVAAIYPGLILYPLSDLPAVVMLALALAAARASGTSAHPWLWSAASGAAAYAAYNTRTIYMFAVLLIVVLLPVFFQRQRSASIRCGALAFFCLGAFILALPQMFINHRHHGTYSPVVVTTVRDKSLMASQLFWGMAVQRYETSTRTDAPAASFYYVDPAGLALRSRQVEMSTHPTVGAYLHFAVRHPLAFLGIYGRHLINGLDVRDGAVYSSRLSQKRDGASLGCAFVLFVCMVIIVSRSRRWSELVVLSPFLIVVAAIVPGAVETRFFVPVYVVLLAAATTQFEPHVLRALLRRRWPSLSLGFAAFVILFMATTTQSMASLVYTMP
jgi:hypothetical protein